MEGVRANYPSVKGTECPTQLFEPLLFVYYEPLKVLEWSKVIVFKEIILI